jgi:hypothetical protein
MKCPKCGYISFDYNQICPKCNKNITAEQEKFNLPSFRPDPPSLLGFLTGDANESNVNLRAPARSHIDSMHDDDIGLNDSVILNHDKLGIEDQDLDISFEPEDTGEDLFEKEAAAEPENVLSDADFRLEDSKGGMAGILSGTGEDEEISLDLGDLALEEPMGALDKSEDTKASQSMIAEGMESDVEISLDSLESLPADINIGLDEMESEIELDLDDLKVSDLGNLEIDADMELSEKEMESTLVESEAGTLEPEIGLSDEEEDKLPDISELILEEAQAGRRKEKTMILDDLSLDDSGPYETEGALELGEMPLEDFSLEEKKSMDMEDLKLDSDISGEAEKTLILDDLSMNDSAELEKSFDISDFSLDDDYAEGKTELSSKKSISDNSEIDLDLDAMSLDVEEYQKGSDSGDDFVLDLDDMDIDLDLNKPKK